MKAATSSVKDNNKWYQSVWLPFAAATYIIICIFDFMIMPVYVAAHNSKIEAKVFAGLEGKDVATFATTISQTSQATRQWNPLTLLGAGMFHMAFGALLTGGAVTRGMAKKSELEGYYKYGAAGYEDDEYDYRYGNRPYKENRYGRGRQPSNRYRNEREGDPPPATGSDGPMPKTTDLDEEN
jgi:hypothetical protein